MKGWKTIHEVLRDNPLISNDDWPWVYENTEQCDLAFAWEYLRRWLLMRLKLPFDKQLDPVVVCLGTHGILG